MFLKKITDAADTKNEIGVFYFVKQFMINSHVKFNLTRLFPRESVISMIIML